MIDVAHLDTVERFAHWMERRRKEAGLTQRELASLAGMSHSYYTKIVHIGHLRRIHGDSSRELAAPREIKTFEGVLSALEEKLGSECREEGLKVWSGTSIEDIEVTRSTIQTVDDSKLLTDTLDGLLKLPEYKLRLVFELVQRLK